MISEFPLLVFTVLTSIAAGSYVAAAAFPRKGTDGRPWLLPVVAIVLVAIGGLAATTHLGRPANILNVLNNPIASLTMEGIVAGLLALVALVDAVLCFTKKSANRIVRIVGAVVGVALLCVVTYAYVTSYGNPVWISTPSYLVFVVAGLAAGFAFWQALANAGGTAAPAASTPSGASTTNSAPAAATAPALSLATAVLNLLFALVLVWQAVVFSGFGEAGFAPIAAGAVLAVAAAACAFLVGRKPGASSQGTAGNALATALLWAAAILAIAALIVSRYGFYMASII